MPKMEPHSHFSQEQVRNSIETHCEKCYPNLHVAANSRNKEIVQKNKAKYRNIRNKNKTKRKQVKEAETEAMASGCRRQFQCSFCKKEFGTEAAATNCKTNCK